MMRGPSKSVGFATATTLLVLAAAGCGGSAPSSPGGGDVKVGVVIPLSGVTATVGQNVKKAYDLAASEINASGGIGGKKLDFLYQDSTGLPDVGGRAARQLIQQDHVVALTGSYESSVTLVVAQTAEQAKVPYLVPYSAANKITESGYKFTFRTRPPSKVWAKTMADFLKSYSADGGHPTTKVGLLLDDTAYGQGTGVDYRNAAAADGMQVVDEEIFTEGDTALQTQIVKLKSAGAQAILAASYLQSTTGALNTMANNDFKVPYLTLGTGIIDQGLFKLGQLADGVAGATSWSPQASTAYSPTFTAAYQKAYGVPPPDDAAYAYSAAYILKAAIEDAKSVSPAALTEALRTQKFTSPQATLIPSQGGSIKFDANGQANTVILIAQAQDGKYQVVYPPKVASSKLRRSATGWY